MAVPVIMPKQGQTVESCIITKWHKKKGDRVEAGELLFSYETDKASFDEEAKVSGVLLDIFFDEGEEVPVLTNVCVIGEPGENVEKFNPRVSVETSNTEDLSLRVPDKIKERQKAQDQVVQGYLPAEGKIKISPRARRLAEKLNVDFRFAKSSGPDGRIIERDILELFESGPVFTRAAKQEAEKIEESDGFRDNWNW